MDAVMSRGFNRASETYERARPDYPPAALRFLCRTFDIGPGKTVVDIGAGTGKLTKQLVKTRAKVIAVEPIPGMRKVLRRTVPGVKIVPRKGEDTGLPSGSVDLITVAQAFHWLDAKKALREFRRILRPGGGLAIIYNWRTHDGAWGMAARKLLDEYRPKRFHELGRKWRKKFTKDTGFTRLVRFYYANSQTLSRKMFVERYMSLSFIAALPTGRRQEFHQKLDSHLRSLTARTGRKTFTIKYRGRIYWCRLKER
jgi:SAM-dependent methyltransferase